MSRRDYFREQNKLRKVTITFTVALAVTVVAFIIIFTAYNNKLRQEAQKSLLQLGSVNAIVPNSNITEITNPVSTTKDKGINEVKNEIIKENQIKTENIVEEITDNTVEEQNVSAEEIVDENKQLEFTAPVIGEISKDFASDTLLYSKTLDEWTTHTGIDIKAEKTTIVVASEVGVIESIKNDPRYGLTVTITHKDGFKTIYSNLLSTEFITEGETVERGQTIATVGESSSFEIADETHLHFEMTKDGEYVNPTVYLK